MVEQKQTKTPISLIFHQWSGDVPSSKHQPSPSIIFWNQSYGAEHHIPWERTMATHALWPRFASPALLDPKPRYSLPNPVKTVVWVSQYVWPFQILYALQKKGINVRSIYTIHYIYNSLQKEIAPQCIAYLCVYVDRSHDGSRDSSWIICSEQQAHRGNIRKQLCSYLRTPPLLRNDYQTDLHSWDA